MSIQVGNTIINKETVENTGLAKRLSLFILFLMCGLAIFVFGSNYYEIFPTNRNISYNAVLSAVFLIASLWLKRNERLTKYWQIPFAFFIASFAILFTLIFDLSGSVLGWFNLTTSTSQGIAIAKLFDMVMIILPIIMLTKLSGAELGTIYLKRGNFKWGLFIGALVLFNFASSAFLFFATRYTSIDKLGAAVLWGVVFSFANSFMEELLLRGIFLKRFEPLLGIMGSVLLTSIMFSLMHIGSVYLTPVAIPFMLANTLTLGLACGYLMMKTDSIWGATLIHAAADFFLFIAMLASV